MPRSRVRTAIWLVNARWSTHSSARPARVNGTAGAVISVRGRPIAVMGFTVVEDRIVAIDAIADRERVQRIARDELGGS